MSRWYLFFLAALGLAVYLLVAVFQHTPGYMDAEYYYAGGLRLAGGDGFTEPFIWNYLDNPPGLPHPSHTYWMPLASLVAYLGIGCRARRSFPQRVGDLSWLLPACQSFRRFLHIDLRRGAMQLCWLACWQYFLLFTFPTCQPATPLD